MKPLLLVLTLILCCQTCLVFSATFVPLQVISLLSLKSSLQDPLSTFHDWDLTPTFSKPNFQDPVWCSWSGIKCQPNTVQVVSLDLSLRNLSGCIPTDIRYLSSLVHLNISGNHFDGTLPAAIFELAELRTLDISNNFFNSSFPPGISKLKSLKVFNAFSNSFTGPLPEEFSRLKFLEHLNLGGSYFSDRIPSGYENLQRLKFLNLAGNSLNGPVTPELGFLRQLQHLEIGYNQFSGGLPQEIVFLSSLTYLDISSAKLSGTLVNEIGNLIMLESLLLFSNHFTGEIPSSIGNLKALKYLDLSDNEFSGPIPVEITSLKELTILSLLENNLTGEIPQGIGDLPNLETLHLWNNSLTGVLPQDLGSNGLLQKLDVSSNSLTGPIPQKVCFGNNLIKLILFSNRFDSPLPLSLANCTSLTRVRIQNNNLNGSIPVGLSFLPSLIYLDMSNNRLTGQIPDFANAVKLEYLNISANSFVNPLPQNIWNASSLQVLSASSSNITGKIPDFIDCQNLYKLELQDNLLNGTIPWGISHCEKLVLLNLSRNSLTGIIPWEISTLPSITDVDLSHNLLTGTIPSNFNNCTTLMNLNVSSNLLTGPIPSSGSIFPNLHPSSFSGNEGLCGSIVAKPCAADAFGAANNELQPQKKQPRRTAGSIVWIVAAAFGVGLFVLVAGTRCFQANYSRRFSTEHEIRPWKLTAFQRLNFTAEDVLECLSMSDKIIGMGSTGTVYKAEMPGGEIIAVKKLWGKHKNHTIRRKSGVLAEVDVLGNVRHRNIVRLLGCFSNKECTMLFYEYMPNGNLDDLLHGKNKGDNLGADWVTRYNIALGVAQGICYLHHDCDPVIVHRDLKPSNILLDGDMEARVADFGVAKLIQSHESMSVIAGSYGYIAPEYAYTLQVDEKSDIYSYGVVLMEILTGKRSVHSEFGDGNNIVDWIRCKIKSKDGVDDILDKNAGAGVASVKEEMIQMLRIALLCTSRNPADRPSMRDVVLMLQEAKPKRKVLQNGGVAGRIYGDNNGVGGDEGGDIALTQKQTSVEN